MIWRASGDTPQSALVTDGPYAGMIRLEGALYGSLIEVEQLLTHRTASLMLVSVREPTPPEGSKSDDTG